MQAGLWWKSAVIYEIYPRSFQDTSNDGIGDLNGILDRLDYLVALGVDAIWITPVYPSPMADFGYDVADYCGIDPIFGTMQDFDRLLAEAHRKGLKVILDFVPNHTSDQHPWFLESRSSRNNPKRDWYLWRDEPNNWRSHFGGSGWQFDELTSQFYYHSFLKEQPDINWRNPAVKAAMFEAMRFWLDKGVDGFRVDVMWLMIKDDQFRDNPAGPPIYNADRPEVHALVAAMRAVIDGYSERVLIGEIYLPVEQLMAYYGQDLKGANLPFNFLLLQSAWNAEAIARTINSYLSVLPPGAWPNWVLGNHDNPRLATRVGSAQTALAALLLFTLPGTLTLYYGEELGMTDVPIPLDEVHDTAEKLQPGIGMGRDPERTPMPWDGSPLGGFTRGRPWLPLGPDHANLNVEAQQQDQASLWHLYRRLITLRRTHPELVNGEIQFVTAEGTLLRYERAHANRRLLVLLNFGDSAVEVRLEAGTILAATDLSRTGQHINSRFQLRGAEGLLLQLDASRANPAHGAAAI